VHRSIEFAELALACLKFPNLTRSQSPELMFCLPELGLMVLLFAWLCLVLLLQQAHLALMPAVRLPVAVLLPVAAVLPVAVAAVVQAAHLLG
jgi:hypothetical protein